MKNQKNIRFNKQACSLLIFNFQLGIHFKSAKAPYLYPQFRFSPLQFEGEREYKQRDRSVKTRSKPIEQFIIAKNSLEGEKIKQLHSQHNGFEKFTSLQQKILHPGGFKSNITSSMHYR